MNTLADVVDAMRKARERWCESEVVDDPEDMFDEYPDFLDKATPILEKLLPLPNHDEFPTGGEI